MRPRQFAALVFVVLITLLLILSAAAAQDDSASLTLFSADSAHPIQFQLLAQGDTPLRSAFTSRVEVDATDDELTVVYVILQNTGWSEGALGLISEALLADESYVALEVEADENGDYVLNEGGLAFGLEYAEALDGEGNAGFVLPLLISEPHTLAIYHITDSAGQTFTGQTNIREGRTVTQAAAEYEIDSEPVFGAIVLDLHIGARVIPDTTAVSTSESEAEASTQGTGSSQSQATESSATQVPLPSATPPSPPPTPPGGTPSG